MDYIYGHDEIVARFVGQLIPAVGEHGFGPHKTFGVLDDDNHLIAGMVYHNYDPKAGIIEMSGAALPGTRWVTPETLARMYQYPFLQLGCQMVVMRVAADNERLLRQLAALNYMLIKVPRMFGREADGVLCLLTYEDWAANKICRRFKHHLVRPEIHLGLEAA